MTADLTMIGGLLAACVVLPWMLAAQPPAHRDSETEIRSLIASLADHSITPAQALDPVLADRERRESLGYLEASAYELSVRLTGPVAFASAGLASVPGRIHLRNRNSEFDSETNITFVQRDGRWYFADYHFLAFPAGLIVVIVLGAIGGVVYATGVLILFYRLKALGNDVVFKSLPKLFIPFYWRRLYLMSGGTASRA